MGRRADCHPVAALVVARMLTERAVFEELVDSDSRFVSLQGPV